MRLSDFFIWWSACILFCLLAYTPLLPRFLFVKHDNSPILDLYREMYDQFVLFGDSLVQHSSSQERGFGLTPALQAGMLITDLGPVMSVHLFLELDVTPPSDASINTSATLEYIRRLDVVNRGFSGYNTNQALKILPRIIKPPEYGQIRFFLVFFGANDACLEGSAGSQHVPLDQFISNTIAIITHPLIKQHNPRIILVTTPPINEFACEENDRTKGYNQPRRSAGHTKLYADAVRKIAEQYDTAIVDLWTVFMKQAGFKLGSDSLPGSKDMARNSQLRLLLHDGLHFTSVAYTMMFQEILRSIQDKWPDQTPEKLRYVLPTWNDPVAWATES